MPLGFYQEIKTVDIHRGDIVSACLPNDISNEGLRRNYLTKGKCASGAIPVVKEVIAVPGDMVKLTNDGFMVNGQFYLAPRRFIDHHGKPIKRFIKQGVYIHVSNYWLYGTHAPIDSWDSRYFGGINREQIRQVMQPKWIF
jgi:conjugative transfer signal peptidase TraF